MRISVISDDLTGASDCGGQLIRFGLKVSVMVQEHSEKMSDYDAVIYNTDSRSVTGHEAYESVKKVCDTIKSDPVDVIYKKIDSTMRGNIGEEINAIFDSFSPDFVIIAPAFPVNGRKVINGIHYLNSVKLENTEVAKDPKTPVRDSEIKRLIENQSKRKVEHITFQEIHQGHDTIMEKLVSCKNNQISYITVDSAQESDLEKLVELIHQTDFSVVWVGSAGLMNYLPEIYGMKQVEKTLPLPIHTEPVLLVVGSVSETGRIQLQHLLNNSETVGLEMNSVKVLQDEELKAMELMRILSEAKEALFQGKNVVLYSSNNVNETRNIGEQLGYDAVKISNIISMRLGELAAEIISIHDLKYLFLTGGDTAQQVFLQLNAKEFILLDEVESGIPLGRVSTDKEFFIVTKAGNFGSKEVMLKALYKLHGRDYDEADYRDYHGRRRRSGI
ncbi:MULTISPECIES: four-carbon acid sugar kinase family protein [unclassified Niallia]|uniref:four-carbon acid sugar kinase family protein n=1 Tax=unclassified Niallia TaxID=2837522 RepID=UPI001EDB7F1E|nr:MULTISPECIES: four-carbon acid sugar kinase family protein [unclassified Niallia]MDL0436102.1 four-carbon acid sugar kinase family protein [Niallia sp. SS-2023]UPO86157.1 four-carbon acid sugar kinase family protein [Niallia sp. Man26]